MQDAVLPCLRAATHIYQERSVTAFQVATDTLDECRRPFCLRLYLNEPGDFWVERAVNLLIPVALAVGAGAHDMMFDAAFIQRHRQAVEQDGFARVGWAADQYGRKYVHRSIVLSLD